ncbi:MAG: hypothetical protein WDO73_29275 [Ignavibacteriota bacterium]
MKDPAGQKIHPDGPFRSHGVLHAVDHAHGRQEQHDDNQNRITVQASSTWVLP